MDRSVTLVVVALVVFAGCAGLGGQGDSADPGDGGAGGDGGGADAGAEVSNEEAELQRNSAQERNGDAGDVANARVDRALIRTGTARIEVENFSATRAAVRSQARARGGYVAASDAKLHRQDNQTWQTGHVVVRVPSDNFSAMLETAQGQGTVLSVDTETKDVTDKLVDLNARLENLRAQRDQLRTFYERANTTEELLRVQERLSSVQSDIERLEAKKRSLEDRVAFSTLRVEIAEPRPESDDPEEESTAFHEQSPLGAFLGSVQGVITFGQALFIAGVTVLPWILALGVPVALVLGVSRRFSGFGRGSDSADLAERPTVESAEDTTEESTGTSGEHESARDDEE